MQFLTVMLFKYTMITIIKIYIGKLDVWGIWGFINYNGEPIQFASNE